MELLNTDQKYTLVYYLTQCIDVAANTKFEETMDKLYTLASIMDISGNDRIQQVCELWIAVQIEVVNKYFNNFMSTAGFSEIEVDVLKLAYAVQFKLKKPIDARDLRVSPLSQFVEAYQDKQQRLQETWDDWENEMNPHEYHVISEYSGEVSMLYNEEFDRSS